MWLGESPVKIWLCRQSTDMRKSFDGLVALVKNQMQRNPLTGDLFVFFNRKRTYVKILYFDRSGYCIWSKRLEQGTFSPGEHVQLNWMQLRLILEGIELTQTHQRRRYQPTFAADNHRV